MIQYMHYLLLALMTMPFINAKTLQKNKNLLYIRTKFFIMSVI